MNHLNEPYLIAGRWHPGYSLLGRWLRHCLKDPLRAEAALIVVLSGVAVAWFLAQYLAWALLQDAILADPRGPVAVGFFLGQLVTIVLVLGVGVLGFQPPATVTCGTDGLTLRRKKDVLYVPYEALAAVETISSVRFHRHYRRYAATRIFVNRMEDCLLLLHTPHGPVVVGLRPPEHAALVTGLRARMERVPELSVIA